ncbi:hypothetical protein [Leptospira sp. 'Mane']|uniref:hypothetical protein n=1 Tax=Leptospira sp. 'Mane' TaxID=3387407 RepID=UPI00398AA161
MSVLSACPMEKIHASESSDASDWLPCHEESNDSGQTTKHCECSQETTNTDSYPQVVSPLLVVLFQKPIDLSFRFDSHIVRALDSSFQIASPASVQLASVRLII